MCANKKQTQQVRILKVMRDAISDAEKRAGTTSAWDSEHLSPVLRHSKLGPLSCSNEARRRVWRMVRIAMGLPVHEGEAEGVVMEDDAVLIFCVRGRARYAQSHVPFVLNR